MPSITFIRYHINDDEIKMAKTRIGHLETSFLANCRVRKTSRVIAIHTLLLFPVPKCTAQSTHDTLCAYRQAWQAFDIYCTNHTTPIYYVTFYAAEEQQQ